MTGAFQLAEANQIPVGEGRTFKVDGVCIAVFRTHAGEVFATQPACPHLGGPLADGLTGGATIVCPLHERAYDLRTGAGLNGEATCLKVYPAALDADGTIWVTLGK
jgi:nitrite reductase (NADH) small subunit